jgi:DNA polymerase V
MRRARAEKLRRQYLATVHLVVCIETNGFKADDAQHYAALPVWLTVATNYSSKLIGATLAGLASIWYDGYRYKKAGVVLLDLYPAADVQVGLFDKADHAPRHADAGRRSTQRPLRP